MNMLERLQAALSDRYRLERELGRGGMATVFLAEDRKHHRRVAVKVLRPELAATLGSERFLREIELSAGLTHPHILPLHDSGDAGGVLYYVMPYVEGESLRSRLAREKQLPVEEAVQIAREIADALGYAHARGVVHRDIKPENVLLESGHAVVADFGIARALSAAGGSRLTETGVAVGTPAYMSPEQASGESDVDGRSDLYSLGCMLYEMLTGETPYTGPTPHAIFAKKLTEPVPRVTVFRDTVPAGVEATLLRALARAPADRFSTAQQFADALTAGGAEHVPPAIGTVSHALRSTRRWTRIAAAAVVVLLGAGAWWSTHLGSQRPIRRLALLPLASFTNDSTQQYFVEGVHNALIFDLQQAGVRVLGRTSVLRYAHTDIPVRQIARELGVDGVIEGSVLRAGDSVEISLRLIDGRTEEPRWQESYPGDMASILSLYHGVTRSIAAEIQNTLSPQAFARLASARRLDPRVYDDYLQGQFHWQRLTPGDLDQALEYFQRALRRDSTYALAWSGIAMVWVGRAQMGLVDPGEATPKGVAAVRRALALDSTLVEVQTAAAGVLAWHEWNWADADGAFRKAIQINPGYPDVRAFYSHFLHIMKRPVEARAQMDAALELDPLNAMFRGFNGMDLLFEGRPADAVGELRKALDGGIPGIGMNIVSALALIGRYDEAFAELRNLYPGDEETLGALNRGYEEGGFRGAMRRAAEISIVRPPAASAGPFLAADWYALAGDRERTLEWLERALEVHDPNMPYINVWPNFAFVRDEPRFQALCQRMGVPG